MTIMEESFMTIMEERHDQMIASRLHYGQRSDTMWQLTAVLLFS